VPGGLGLRRAAAAWRLCARSEPRVRGGVAPLRGVNDGPRRFCDGRRRVQVCGHLALLSLEQFQMQTARLREHPVLARPHAGARSPTDSPGVSLHEDQNPSKSPNQSPGAAPRSDPNGAFLCPECEAFNDEAHFSRRTASVLCHVCGTRTHMTRAEFDSSSARLLQESVAAPPSSDPSAARSLSAPGPGKVHAAAAAAQSLTVPTLTVPSRQHGNDAAFLGECTAEERKVEERDTQANDNEENEPPQVVVARKSRVKVARAAPPKPVSVTHVQPNEHFVTPLQPTSLPVENAPVATGDSLSPHPPTTPSHTLQGGPATKDNTPSSLPAPHAGEKAHEGAVGARTLSPPQARTSRTLQPSPSAELTTSKSAPAAAGGRGGEGGRWRLLGMAVVVCVLASVIGSKMRYTTGSAAGAKAGPTSSGFFRRVPAAAPSRGKGQRGRARDGSQLSLQTLQDGEVFMEAQATAVELAGQVSNAASQVSSAASASLAHMSKTASDLSLVASSAASEITHAAAASLDRVTQAVQASAAPAPIPRKKGFLARLFPLVGRRKS